MNKQCVEYDIYEPDLEKLCNLIYENNITECIVYGIGNNGTYFFKCLKAMGVEVKYYIDVQAKMKPQFKGKPVITPEELISKYLGEYVLVSPNNHNSIVDFLNRIGISNDKLLKPFYLREKIAVDYGYHLTKASEDIDYYQEKLDNPAITVTSIIYNTDEYLLRRAFESILRQKYKSFRYVIIINGATDNSYKIAKEYEKLDARVEVINLDKNYKWTDKKLLEEINSHLYGDFWCQLDGDDYYSEDFLETTVWMGERGNADMVAVRTMAIAADSNFDLMDGNISFDGKDKFWFYFGDPLCHAFSQNQIMEELALGRVSGTWWGKLWGIQVTKRYFEFLLNLSEEIRGCFFRLDTAMTYKMLTFCERVYFSDKVLHYQSYSPGRTTYSKAPIEWLMSLWYVYKDLKSRFFRWYDYDTAKRYINKFLDVFIPWMVARRGLLDDIEASPYKTIVMENLNELYNDTIFMDSILKKVENEVTYREFYKALYCICDTNKDTYDSSEINLDDNINYERIIGYGAKGKNAMGLLSRLMNTVYFPTELWDLEGDDKLIKRPNIESLTENDLILVFPTNALVVESIKKMFKNCKAKVVYNKEISRWLFENKVSEENV